MKGNILLLWDRMGDYHTARWMNLKQSYKEGNVFAADLASSDKLYGWKNEEKEGHYILSSKPIDKPDILKRTKRFLKIIRGNKINYLCIAGYAHIEYIVFIILAKLMGIKILMFAESWYQQSRAKNKLKGKFLQFFVHKIFVSGKLAYNHFSEKVNINTSKLVTGYSVVDNVHFERQNGKSVLGKYKTLLCIARFAPEKNLELLINAFNMSILSDWQLTIVGGGPLQNKLEELIINKKVKLLDWVEYNKLPGIYHSADCFILPSKFEPWGLVINEAMSANLPIIASTKCGCIPELVTSKNGWVFNPDDLNGLINILNQLAVISPDELNKKGQKSKQIIRNYSLTTWSESVIKSFSI